MAWEYVSNNYEGRTIKLTITETVNKSSNSSTLNWTLTSAGGIDSYYTIGETTVKINGTQVYHKSKTVWDSYEFPAKKGSKSGSITITHNADGTKTGIPVSFKTRVYNFTPVEYAGSNIDLTAISTYTLSTSAGTGSSITVNRTASGYASTGNLSNGARLYYGDTLKITFTPGTNYSITTHTVNGSTFTSGNTHTVSGDVTVTATATPLKSTIGATDANIGSTSTITVTRYNSSYTHTITYKLGNATGTIVTKGTSTSIAWTVPDAFYAQIPNAKTGTCTLTIETFNGSTSLGTNTCTLKVTASSSACSPTVVGTVVDTNATTKALTGNENTLIRYKSTAKCTLTATPKNSATISTTKIGGSAVTGTSSGGVVTATKNYTSVSATSFSFDATDSRGYSGSQTVNPSVIAYIQLTINPTVERPVPTGDTVELSFSGNYYRGSFGAYSNTLTIRYRYKETTTAAFSGGWTTVPSTSIVYGTGTYRTSAAITLDDTFDYRKSYDFQIQAYDGANGTALTTVTRDLVIKRGIPVFDWGENDFNFHVPVKIGDTTLTEQQLQQLLALLS